MRRLAVIVPSYNRAASLQRTLAALAADAADVIVVDNNSTDETPAVVARFAPRVRYVREVRQGVSFARNAGIQATAALGPEDIVAFVDDDVEPGPGWRDALLHAFDDLPAADCIGGRVLPRETTAFPRWLTASHWGPLALQDHGPATLMFDAATPRGLIGASFAFRRRVFDTIGPFSVSVQRLKNGVTSTEDHELLTRMYAAGMRAAYVPAVVAFTDVPAERLTPAYHRRWHLGHGRLHARMRVPQTEGAPGRSVLGVPQYLFRAAATDVWRWLTGIVIRDRAGAFEAETRLWFFSGFVRERCAPNR